jgi:hypothetical protein
MIIYPLVGDPPQKYRTAFMTYARLAHERDPTVFPPPGDILSAVVAGDFAAFLVLDNFEPVAGIVLSIDKVHNALTVILTGGTRFPEWGDLLDELAQKTATELGLERLWIHGRKGWGKTLRERGFTEKYVVFSREVDDGFRGQRKHGTVGRDEGSRLSGDPEAVPSGHMDAGARHPSR